MTERESNSSGEQVMSETKNWRTRPFARVVVHCSCTFMLITSGGPLYAAPPTTQLPTGGVVTQGSASISTAGNTMTVNQTSNKAILGWESFNIGNQAAVQFNQPSASAIALNKIGGNSASEIFGKLGANGSVYLINNNGILFGAGSQVNVHGLVASTLTLNMTDAEFMNSGLASPINDRKAVFEGGTASNARIVVEPKTFERDGSGNVVLDSNGIPKEIPAASIRTDSGGQVLMFAPNVINSGDISTPDGQTILAATTDKVYLASSNNDNNLRGLLVEVATGGDVTNVGNIVAERGNITLLGLAVNQNGRVTATTSIDVNGSIRLLARDHAEIVEANPARKSALLIDNDDELPKQTLVAIAKNTDTGYVKFGANSVTEVIADTQLDAKGKVRTAPDAQTQNHSRIDAMAQTIVVGDNATLSAKSGRINLTATNEPETDPGSTATRNSSRIYIGKNAVLDVSGENVELGMDRRVVDVELRGDELKDSPLQRNGVLRGKTVKVDIATGSPLIADLQPTLTKVQKDVKERNVEGGTINLRSQGDVVLADNVSLNTSGGSITYAAGFINTTKLLTQDGHLVDIGSADPNQRYAGIFGEHTEIHPKWGKTTYGETSALTIGTYRDSFTEGKNAGTLNIVAQALHGLDRANLQAGAQRGATQRALSSLPLGGSINIELGQVAGTQQNVVLDQAAHSAALGVDDAITGDTYISAAALNASGAGKFSLKANGHIEVTESAAVKLNAGSTFALTGTSLDFKGSVRTPSGSVALTTTTPAGPDTGLDDAQPLTIATGSHIDVSGNWINDLLDIKQSSVLAPLALKGGSILLSAKGDLDVAQGASLLANAGAQITSAGAFKGGDGGSITISTNARSATDEGSVLTLKGKISAYGYAQGGKLILEANGIHIGGSSGSDERIFQIDPLFFTEGGFSDFTLTANLLGLEVAPQTTISLVQKNQRVSDLAKLVRTASGADISASVQPITLEDYQRNPVNLHLNALQTVNKARAANPAFVRIGEGAHINGDNGARIDLSTTGNLFVDGSLQAHGGVIDLSIKTLGDVIDRGYEIAQSLWLGSHAQLDVSAGIERANDPLGQSLDTVFDAGSIKLTAERGFIVAEPGSVLDVSAPQSYQINLPRTLANSVRARSVTLNPAAGSIAFTAADGIAVFSTLRGQHTGTALAGSIAYLLDGNNRLESNTNNFDFFPLEMQVAQSQSWSNLQFGTALPSALRGKGLISADAISSGGFGSLDLSVRNKTISTERIFNNSGSIVFGSDVALSLSDALTLGTTNIDLAGHSVALSAATVTLGGDFWEAGAASQIKQATVAGNGSFSLNGKTLDVVGNIGISGAAHTDLLSTGDLRLRSVIDGTTSRSFAAAELTTPGDLTLQAAQIYPSTLSDYTIRLEGAQSVLRTRAAGNRAPVFSAGGKLTLQAPVIEHAGVLAAPLGTIILNASASIHLAKDSVIDVSAHDLLIPFGRLRGGELNWIYPIDPNAPLVITSPPQKSVVLSAPTIQMDDGAKVDLSGGGDIYAFEQIPGPGGSKDFLDVANANGAFAVMPALGTSVAPYDSVEMKGSGIKLGATIWLDGSSGLPAGNYTVLPAHYALLPGAYLITPYGASSPVALPNSQLIDGTTVVSGRLGRGTSDQYATQWQSFTVETGAAARLRSEYTELTGGVFFKDSNVDVAADAGRMTISAQTALALNGTINAVAQNGRGAQLDIIADKISVVADGVEEIGNGVVTLVASALNKLGVDSLMLGGQRTRNGDDTNVVVRSDSLRIEDGAALQAPDIILAARDSIDVGVNASVSGRGESKVNTRAFVIDGDGALLRASSAEQSNVQRTNSSGVGGNLRLDSTATLAADKALLLDASGEMAIPGMLSANNGSLNISANRISFGAVPTGTSGAALTNAQLNALQVQTLRLSSRSSLDFFGDVVFSNQHTELNAGQLRNLATGNVRITASDTLQLENGTGAPTVADAASTGGNLILDAKSIVLGHDGDAASTMQLQGFDNVQLGNQGVTQSVRGSGDFTLHSNSLTIYADTISADSAGAKTKLLVADSVTLNQAGAAAITTPTAAVLGANLTIEGKSIANGTRIDLPSGTVVLNANGSAANDNVTLVSGGEIDVSGRSIATPHASMNTSGGQIKLTSTNGNVVADSNSIIRLSGGEKGGDAGALNVSAVKGQALLNGSLIATKASGARGANLAVDASTLANINSLLALANSSGVDNSLLLRARSGDIAITQNAHASNIDISADIGKLSLASTLDVSGANGGRVALYSGDDLELQSSAIIDARATVSTGRGGQVELGSTAGALRLAGGINVSGGEVGRDGLVNLRVQRSVDNNSVSVFNNGIAITGAERVQLAAFKTYQSTTLDADLLEQARLDAIAFMLNEDSIKAGLGSLVSDKFHLVPEIEVQSTGDLAVNTAVDFAADNDGDYQPDTTWRFGSALEAPVLTLRAAGDLTVSESLSDGVYRYKDPQSKLYKLAPATRSKEVEFLLSGDSASYRLIAGSDLGAANPDVTGTTGNLIVSGGADVVTGTGSIILAAGANLIVDSPDTLIASLGSTAYTSYTSPVTSGSYAVETVPDTGTFNAVYAYLMGNTLPQYPHAGGDVSLRAGNNIDFQTPSRFFSSWMERIAGPFSLQGALIPKRTFELTTWGVMLDYLKEGVVALGGGNVNVDAGGSISNLNVALPSTGKQIGVNANLVEIVRSGSLSVSAGQNILSPRLLVDNGSAELRAGGNIGASDGSLQTVAVLGDSALLLRANGDIGVDAIFNTTVMPQSKNQTGNVHKDENYFFTYGDNSEVTIESVQGNVSLNNDKEAVLAAFNGDFPNHANTAGFSGSFGTINEQRIFELYPARLNIFAASGDIQLKNNVLLFPAADGQLNLLAGGDILAATDVRVRQSDVDLASLPGLYSPVSLLDYPNAISSPVARLFDEASTLAHANTPVHLNDNEPSVIDALGDIVSEGGALYQLAEATKIAARDIVSTSFAIQNNRGSDVSEIITQRDIVYPLIVTSTGALTADKGGVVISGPGRLDIFAGRNIDLGTSSGFVSNGNTDNPNLPDSGADLNVLAGINGATAFTDYALSSAFVEAYLNAMGGPSGSYIDWFGAGNFTGDATQLLTVFTGKSYASRDAALASFATLSVLTQQAISLEAWRSQRAAALALTKSKSGYSQLGGLVNANDYSADLIDFVSFDRFGGDLRSAVNAFTHTPYATNEAAAIALAALPAAQQHQIAKTALVAASTTARRELLSDIFLNEIRQGGVEKQSGFIAVAGRDGFDRSYAAIERMFPGKQWNGDISLVFSELKTLNGGDINFFAPGGGVDVGLAGQFAGTKKEAGELGIITQRYGAINGFTDGDIKINQSRISSLDGAGIELWSTHGDIDAGRGAKSALTIPPPKTQVNDDGSITLVFDAAVSGSGIQSARNNRKLAGDRGPLQTDSNDAVIFGSDSRTDRDRYSRSLAPGSTYLFAPSGAIDAGDAGISVEGNLLVAAQTVRGADNISVGGISIGVPTTTSIGAGTLSLGDVASSATESATNSMNDAIREAASALAESSAAFVTVDIIGVGN